MVKIKFIKKSKRMLVIALALLMVIGISLFYVTKKLEEKQRNREYEVNLINTLKNSYEGIEEIEIKNPSYSSIPSDAWGADVKFLIFIKIGLYHNEDEEFQSFMDSRRGTTKSRVRVRYSDGSEEKQ